MSFYVRFGLILTPTFSRYLPWLILIWVMTIILDIILLRRGRWQPVTHWLSVDRSIFAIVVLYTKRRAATRSYANSLSVELTNTQSRWSGVRITGYDHFGHET